MTDNNGMTNDIVVMFEGTIYEEGYGWVAQKVMRDKELHATAKAIYAYICSMAGNPKNIDNRKAFPSVSLMKAELGIKSQDTFYKYMNQLKSKGYLKVERQKDELGKFKRNIYKIIAVPKLDNPEEKPKSKFSTMEKDPKSKNQTMDNPKSDFSTTDNPTSENWNTNRNSFNRNSFNIDNKRDTYKDTGNPDLSTQQEQDKLLKESLKEWIPQFTHHTLSVFSKDYDEMYEWFGIILRAKDQVEKKKGFRIELEAIDYDLNKILISGIRAIKNNQQIKSKNKYLYKTILNGLDKLFVEEKSDSILSYNWLANNQ